SRSHRLANVAERTDRWNEMHRTQLCKLLWKRWRRAVEQLRAANSDLSSIRNTRPELTNQELERLWAEQQATQGPTTAANDRSARAAHKEQIKSYFQQRDALNGIS
ncbi:hypothetical protein JCM5350_005037, partial [Sporobolomyces pararoseus]